MRIRRVLVIGLALSVSLTACGGTEHPSKSTSDGPATTTDLPAAATSAAARFLARYVTSDGRVIRHDQGGDIVSEGQAYAMLIAELVNRPGLVRTIWSWTNAHLARPDGLFAWHATGSGRVVDPESATDADVLIAYALLRYSGTDAAALHEAGHRVAKAVLDNESVTLPDGAPLLVAGPWAKTTSLPTVDPSYLMPGVFAGLANLTGDARWSSAATTAVNMVRGLTNNGLRLPPDWARLSGGRLVATAAAGGGAGVQYGLDAARVPVWFATACSTGARSLAASWWHNVLGSGDNSGPIALSLDGTTIDAASSPLTLLAGAAAATAAGDESAARALRERAAALALSTPTYYGDAWGTLGPALLDRAVSPCEEASDG